MSWCTIESDPGVFTSLIEDIGVKGVQVEELYSLDDDTFANLAPIYGLIFLFKWDPQHQTNAADGKIVHDHGLFFAKQVINNACATQAILSILMNVPALELGDTLADFKASTAEFPPDLKGLAISNVDKVRTAHNSFARAEPFAMDESVKGGEKDDVYHFVAYLPFNGKVYELDGLQEGPILLSGESDDPVTGDNWLKVVRPAIQTRIEKYQSSEIRFSLLGLIQNRKQLCEEKIAELSEQPESPSTISMIQNLQDTIKSEETKFRQWRVENERRKHNYVPFIVRLLQMLAQKDKLQPLIDKQLENQATQQQQQQQ